MCAAERKGGGGMGRMVRVNGREMAAALAGDAEGAGIAAGEFREMAAYLAGNGVLNELITVFLTRLQWLFGQHDDLVAMAEEHRIIYEAMAARDSDALRTLIPQHLASGRLAAEQRLARG